MRRIIALVFCIAALFTCTVNAGAAAVLEDKVLVGVEQIFTVDITLENEDVIKAAAISEITYDTTRFELTDSEWILMNRPFMDAGYYPDDEVPMAVMAYEDETDCNGPVFRLRFKVKSGAKAGTSKVGCVFMVDGPNPIEVKEATITLEGNAPGIAEPVQIALWVALGLAVVAGGVVVAVILRRKKRNIASE